MQLFNLLIKYFKLLKITCTQWVSLLNFQKLLYSRSYNTPLKTRVKLYKRQQRQFQKEISFKWEKIYWNRPQSPTAITTLELVKCGVCQRLILAPLLSLLYINDLKNLSSLLDPVMFSDDTTLFYTHRNIHCLFSDVNKELANINEWFIVNKLLLNVKKTKYSFFHKPSKTDNILLQLPNLTNNNRKIKREESRRFLGVLLGDENITWKEHLRFIGNKCANNIGLLYKGKHHLNKKCSLAF